MRGDRKVTSAYAEVVVPLVTEDRALPLVKSLELSASGRFEHYSDFGDTTKPKIGANWRPVSWLMLRGSYNEGFMAPSLAALYTSTRWSISTNGTADPYLNAAIGQGNYTMRNYFGGNPDLKPQESKGTTFGFVLDVPAVSGLSITADYWQIKRTDLLGQRANHGYPRQRCGIAARLYRIAGRRGCRARQHRCRRRHRELQGRSGGYPTCSDR